MSRYVRKTRDVFIVQSCYDGIWSDEAYEDSMREAKLQAACYRRNIRYPIRIVKRRERKSKEVL